VASFSTNKPREYKYEAFFLDFFLDFDFDFDFDFGFDFGFDFDFDFDLRLDVVGLDSKFGGEIEIRK
jgi:hypothetical protein